MTLTSKSQLARPTLVRVVLACAMAFTLVLSIIVTPSVHVDGLPGIAAVEAVTPDGNADLAGSAAAHCHCPQATPASAVLQAPCLDPTSAAYVLGDDHPPATIAWSPQPKPPRA